MSYPPQGTVGIGDMTKAVYDPDLDGIIAEAQLGRALVRKTSDEVVNNSTALQNDDELLLPVGANELWYFMLLLKYNTSEVAGLKIGWSVPTGTTMLWGIIGTNAEQTETGSLVIRGVGADRIYAKIHGLIVAGTTAGNIQNQWAQAVAEESDTKVLTNSCIFAQKLA